MDKLVLFGAGKIGRAFIGQLFSRSGYEVVFVDIFKPVVDALNEKRGYNVRIADDNPGVIEVKNVRALLFEQESEVVDEIVSASVLAVSVGKNGLKGVLPLLSKALLKREEVRPGSRIDMILAENMREADKYIFGCLKAIMPESYPLEDRLGLVETSIGKMVPIIANADPTDLLTVSAEAFNTLIVDGEAFKNPIPAVAGMEAKTHMPAWVDRKLFIHNFGHAATAYAGYALHPERKYIWEQLEDEGIRGFVREAMLQSAATLVTDYPQVFTHKDLEEHIDDLLRRFRNRALGDTVYRVGCDVARKLSYDDRIVSPLRSAQANGLSCNRIADVIRYALQFRATGPDGRMFPGDEAFFSRIAAEGRDAVLREVAHLSDSDLQAI